MAKKILVVDDCQDTLNILGAFLRKEGFKVQVESSGQEALQKIKEAPPDLILLDLMMPGIDGMGVCRILKADPGSKKIPIFMFSATDEPDVREKARQAGVSAFIPKPAYLRDILRRINSQFGRSDQESSGRDLFGRLSYGLGS